MFRNNKGLNVMVTKRY